MVFSVTIVTVRRDPVFADLAFGRRCVDLLAATLGRFGAVGYAHCLMPDHAHLLLGVGTGSLVDVVADWKARCFHTRRERGEMEPFWQRSFWDHGLRGDEGLIETALYILNNPVRAGLVEDWRQYPLCGSTLWDL